MPRLIPAGLLYTILSNNLTLHTTLPLHEHLPAGGERLHHLPPLSGLKHPPRS
jgi:hypothetical protein